MLNCIWEDYVQRTEVRLLWEAPVPRCNLGLDSSVMVCSSSEAMCYRHKASLEERGPFSSAWENTTTIDSQHNWNLCPLLSFLLSEQQQGSILKVNRRAKEMSWIFFKSKQRRLISVWRCLSSGDHFAARSSKGTFGNVWEHFWWPQLDIHYRHPAGSSTVYC